jgi:hypothetical protein
MRFGHQPTVLVHISQEYSYTSAKSTRDAHGIYWIGKWQMEGMLVGPVDDAHMSTNRAPRTKTKSSRWRHQMR